MILSAATRAVTRCGHCSGSTVDFHTPSRFNLDGEANGSFADGALLRWRDVGAWGTPGPGVVCGHRPADFTAAWLVAWPLQEQYSPRREDISALAALDAQHVWIMILGFIALGVGTTALGLGLMDALRGRNGRVGSALVVAAGVGLGLLGWHAMTAAPSCLAAQQPSTRGMSRRITRSTTLSACCSSFPSSWPSSSVRVPSGKTSQWRDLRTYSLVSGVLTLVLLVLYISEPIDGWNGIVQRIFLAVPWIWIVVLGLRLLRLFRRPRLHQTRPHGRPNDW